MLQLWGEGAVLPVRMAWENLALSEEGLAGALAFSSGRHCPDPRGRSE